MSTKKNILSKYYSQILHKYYSPLVHLHILCDAGMAFLHVTAFPLQEVVWLLEVCKGVRLGTYLKPAYIYTQISQYRGACKSIYM